MSNDPKLSRKMLTQNSLNPFSDMAVTGDPNSESSSVLETLT